MRGMETSRVSSSARAPRRHRDERPLAPTRVLRGRVADRAPGGRDREGVAPLRRAGAPGRRRERQEAHRLLPQPVCPAAPRVPRTGDAAGVADRAPGGRDRGGVAPLRCAGAPGRRRERQEAHRLLPQPVCPAAPRVPRTGDAAGVADRAPGGRDREGVAPSRRAGAPGRPRERQEAHRLLPQPVCLAAPRVLRTGDAAGVADRAPGGRDQEGVAGSRRAGAPGRPRERQEAHRLLPQPV